MIQPSQIRRAWMVMILASVPAIGQTQPLGCCGQSFPGAEFMVADVEKSLAFYHDVLGLEYPPGFTGKVAPFGQSQLQLTGMASGSWRVVTLVIPGSTWHVQLVETTGIDRKPVAARRQDIGATGLILYVRDIDASVAALKKAGAPIVTAGGSPVKIGGMNSKSRAILAKDPDGYFMEFRQMDPLPPTQAPSASNVIDARMSLSVADTDRTARYWRDLLDFDVKSDASFSSDKVELTLQGTPGAQVRKSIATLKPDGTFGHPNVVFEFLEFKGVDRRALAPRYQDPGAGSFVMRVKTRDASVRGKEMAEVVKRMKASGQTKIMTGGNDALDQTRRFAMFTQDPDGFIMELTQSTPGSGDPGKQKQ